MADSHRSLLPESHNNSKSHELFPMKLMQLFPEMPILVNTEHIFTAHKLKEA